MRFKLLSMLAAVALLAIGPLAGIHAQTRPTQNPTYIPTGQMAAQTLTTATNSSAYIVQGEGTVSVLITGTHPGLAAAIQGSNNPASVADGSATWVTLQGVTANGLYRVPVSGLTRVRLAVSSIDSGSVVVTMSGSPGPFTPGNESLGAVLTNTLRTAGTVNSAQFINFDGSGVVCTYYQTAESGSPAVTFSIDAYDAASNTYRAWLTSPTILATADNPEYTLIIQPGIQTTSLPSKTTAINLKLPKAFRITQTLASAASTPAITSTIGCNVLQ